MKAAWAVARLACLRECGFDQVGEEVLDAAGGTLLQHTDHEPYGAKLCQPVAPATDVGCAGLFWHSQSGPHFSASRAYDPQAGRWLSRDPAGKAGADGVRPGRLVDMQRCGQKNGDVARYVGAYAVRPGADILENSHARKWPREICEPRGANGKMTESGSPFRAAGPNRRRPVASRQPGFSLFSINVLTSSSASVTRWLSSDIASPLACWIRSPSSLVLVTARS